MADQTNLFGHRRPVQRRVGAVAVGLDGANLSTRSGEGKADFAFQKFDGSARAKREGDEN